MPRDRFLQRKTAVLSKLDKSSIGKWDMKIKKLCENVNKLYDFYTTSSCSGRIILMIEQDKKGKDLFLKVWHDKINFDELNKELNNLIKNKVVISKRNSLGLSVNNKDIINKIIRISSDNLIKFKLEPPIIHIACRDMQKATLMLEKAKSLGFKRSSIITCERNLFIELNSSDRLEFPVIKNGKVIVGDEFLKLVVKISNEKLKKGWMKIKKLEKIV